MRILTTPTEMDCPVPATDDEVAGSYVVALRIKRTCTMDSKGANDLTLYSTEEEYCALEHFAYHACINVWDIKTIPCMIDQLFRTVTLTQLGD